MRTVIGLEVHAQLLTRTKLFCSCRADYFQAPPNTHCCPVCLGMPGALPVLNIRAVEYALKAALALHCHIPERSKFDRKNYFYPDLPKGYQISQYDEPLALGGYLDLELGDGRIKRIRVRRLHLEEDAGKLIHEPGGRTLIDFNRCGVPLVEIVTEPDLSSPKEASAFMCQLRQLLRYLGICSGDMEKGALRCDANISVSLNGMGTKTEIKNLNSFRAVEEALQFELEYQKEILSRGGKVEQSTLYWNAELGRTGIMRTKEEAEDYRYFPDPDLVPIFVDEAWKDRLLRELPELPSEKRRRWKEEYQLPDYDIHLLTEERAIAEYFEAVVQHFPHPKTVSNWMMTELLRLLKVYPGEEIRIPPEDFAKVLQMVEEGEINRNTGKEVIEEAFKTGKPPRRIIEDRGLIQISDESILIGLADQVISEQPQAVQDYISGNEKVLGFLVGQLMAKTKGQANPKLAAKVLRERLQSHLVNPQSLQM